jgi:hypothetical protein
MSTKTRTPEKPTLAVPKFTNQHHPEPTVKRINITPQVATDWLRRDEQAGVVVNRTPSIPRVVRYARDMEADHWLDTGMPIIIDWDGHVRDGLQRLMAIIRSGKTQRMYVVSGVDPAAQIAMDRGRPRSNADDFRIAKKPNATVLSATINLILRWQMKKVLSSHWQPTSYEVNQFETDNAELLENAVREGSRINRNVPKMTRSVIAAGLFGATKVDEDDAAQFFRGLDTGASLDPDSPILALRNAINRYGTKAPKPKQGAQLYQVIKAWNLWRAEKPAKSIIIPGQLTSENFPVMK